MLSQAELKSKGKKSIAVKNSRDSSPIIWNLFLSVQMPVWDSERFSEVAFFTVEEEFQLKNR